MAGGLFDKAIATWEIIWGTDELRAVIEDERSENELLLAQLSSARAENASLQRRLELAYALAESLQKQLVTYVDAEREHYAEIAALRQQLAERNGDTVRQQYGEVDAWREAAKDMVA